MGDGVEAAYASVLADDEGEGEGVPVFVGVGWFLRGGFQGCPVLAVVAGDVGTVGANGDPEFLIGIVGYGRAVAVGWGLGGLPVAAAVQRISCRSSRFVCLQVIPSYSYAVNRILRSFIKAQRKDPGRGGAAVERNLNLIPGDMGWRAILEVVSCIDVVNVDEGSSDAASPKPFFVHWNEIFHVFL